LMTPDKDLGQSIRGTRVVQIDRMRKKLTDEPRLRELRGVGPTSIPDWLGLMGDTADGIPGIPGFGAKSAAAVLAHYERIENIPDDAEKWEVAVRGAKRLAASLAERREDALLYKRLATLAEDAPISRSLAELEWKGVPRGAFEDFCAEMGSERLLTRPRRWAS
jgi:5'-3' exonuclease